MVREAPHVVAVLLTGGVARGTADHLSDIDMTVLARREYLKAGIPALPDECLSPVAIVDLFVYCLEQQNQSLGRTRLRAGQLRVGRQGDE